MYLLALKFFLHNEFGLCIWNFTLAREFFLRLRRIFELLSELEQDVYFLMTRQDKTLHKRVILFLR
jgi:hypothetical protein